MEMSKQLALFLQTKGFGTFNESGVGGNIFINTLPDQPDAAVGIFTTGGPGSDRLNRYGKDALQILIRTVPYDPRVGETKARQIIESLNGYNSGFLVNGGDYIVDVEAVQSGPSGIGKDAKNRFEYSQNFIIEYVKGEN